VEGFTASLVAQQLGWYRPSNEDRSIQQSKSKLNTQGDDHESKRNSISLALSFPVRSAGEFAGDDRQGEGAFPEHLRQLPNGLLFPNPTALPPPSALPGAST